MSQAGKNVLIAGISASVAVALIIIAMVFQDLRLWTVMAVAVIVFVAVLFVLSWNRYLFFASSVLAGLVGFSLFGRGISAGLFFIDARAQREGWASFIVEASDWLEPIPLAICFVVLIAAHFASVHLLPFLEKRRNGLVASSGTHRSPRQQVKVGGTGNVVVSNQTIGTDPALLASAIKVQDGQQQTIADLVKHSGTLAKTISAQSVALTSSTLSPHVRTLAEKEAQVLLEDKVTPSPVQKHATSLNRVGRPRTPKMMPPASPGAMRSRMSAALGPKNQADDERAVPAS